MTDKTSTQTIVSTGGFDSSENHLLLDTNNPGMATDLLNYEVGLNGGYRRIDGFEYFSNEYRQVDAINGEGRILGLALYKTNEGVEQLIAARKQLGSNTYKFYKFVVGSGWQAMTTGFTLNTVDISKTILKIRNAQFNFGNKNYIVFVDGVNFATLYDGTNFYQLKSTNAGGIGAPGGNQLIDSPSVVTVFKSHVFLGGDFDYKAVVSHSAPLDPFTWTSAAGGGQLPSGAEVVAIKPFRDTLYVFGKNQIKSITVNATNFVLNDITSNIGCLATDSVIEMSGDLLFLAPDGIRPISATDKLGDVNIASISKPIQFYVSQLLKAYDMNYLNTVVIRGKSQFRYIINEPTGTKTGVGIIGGLRSNDNATGYEFSRLNGITASCTESGYYFGKETILHGDYEGYVFKQESGNSFNGENISSIYRTPFLTMGDPKIRKLMRTLSVFYRLEGSLGLNIKPTFDWNDPDIINPLTSGQEFQYQVVHYGDEGVSYNDSHVYGRFIRSPQFQTDMDGSFFSIQFAFTSSDQNPPHSIQGFTIEFTPQGRR